MHVLIDRLIPTEEYRSAYVDIVSYELRKMMELAPDADIIQIRLLRSGWNHAEEEKEED